MTDTRKPVRGPDAVRRSLIESAKMLMGMRSPRQVSGRELAQHAGVNYGLIHHYFGTKDNVFAEAVAESTETMGKRWDAGGILPVNTTDDAASYRTFAKLELDEAANPMRDLIRRIVAGQAEASGRDPRDPQLLADVAIATSANSCGSRGSRPLASAWPATMRRIRSRIGLAASSSSSLANVR